MSGFIFNKAKHRFWGIFCNQTMTGRVTETENCQRYFCHWIFRRDCDVVRWIWLRDSLIASRWFQLLDLLLARQCGIVFFILLRFSYTYKCLLTWWVGDDVVYRVLPEWEGWHQVNPEPEGQLDEALASVDDQLDAVLLTMASLQSSADNQDGGLSLWNTEKFGSNGNWIFL